MSTQSKFLISIALFLMLQEVALRIMFPLPELSNFDRALFVPKKNEFQGGFVRNKSFLWWSLPDTIAAFQLNYNRYGFRDEEWQIAKPKGKKRVMFVGDSFVEGIMSQDEQTIPDYFRKAWPITGIQTMNAGMLGTGISEYLQLIADAVPIFSPDMVVMVIYANDFTSDEIKIPSHNLKEEYYAVTKPRLLELLNQYSQGNPVPSLISTQSRTVLPDSSQSTYPFKTRINEMYEHADSALVNNMLTAHFNPYKLNEIMRMERGLREACNLLVPLDFFRYYAEKYDFEPVVVYVPCRHQVSNEYLKYEYQVSKKFDLNIRLTDTIYQTNVLSLKRNCETLGLHFINTSDTLKPYEDNGNNAYWNYDDHMKAAGYEVVGTFVANKLISNN